MTNNVKPSKTQDILLWLEGHGQLPDMPQTLHRFESKWRRPHQHLGELSKILADDTRIARRLIDTANSVLHRGNSNCTSIEQAINRLGMIEARNVVHAVSLHQIFHHRCIDAKQFWRHSIISAFTAKKIADYANKRFNWQVDEQDAFLAGLLHEAGLVLMLRFFYEDYPEMVDAAPSVCSWIDAEQRVFQMSHAVLGAALFKSWHFPDNIVLAIAGHHNPLRLPEKQQCLATITHFAEAATLFIGQSNGMVSALPEHLCTTTESLLNRHRLSVDQLNFLGEQGRQDAESSSMLRMF
jgi:putative nucleotidyltransferase with HDIG domain